ncbi:MAG: hypothetical protein F4Z00_03580 [Acidimicrobiaceae bacterium]|nr:hypothetical protein [Acidimicrobiaceae bacterium]MDE0665176.1 hypothetical protein [Acidimicrobiaceae bacterium]MXY11016.1 hypothetical protein [Acidimicrobiaceae bacterium]MXZ64612.1 hypothetical protein [Acidimicrobiaceae bacterium]MYF34657.1 hypothetical protein [Acidimicrobiaceae bacterium]
MAATQAQRAALYTGLVESMDEEAADTLMDQLPPSGWDQLATKEDLAGVELRLQAVLAAAVAEMNTKFAETNGKLVETNARITESNAELRVAMNEGFAEAAKGRAEIVKSQARQLYVIVATIAAATISIWIALFTGASGA